MLDSICLIYSSILSTLIIYVCQHSLWLAPPQIVETRELNTIGA